MWTAARLVAAILFACVGYVAALFVTDTFPDGMLATYFAPTIAAIGLWQGWSTMGKLVGNGWNGAIGNGIRTSVQITFFGLLFFSLREVFLRSSDLRYGGFGEAVVAALELFIEYFLQMLTAPILASLLIGGVLAGLASEAAHRMWR